MEQNETSRSEEPRKTLGRRIVGACVDTQHNSTKGQPHELAQNKAAPGIDHYGCHKKHFTDAGGDPHEDRLHESQ